MKTASLVLAIVTAPIITACGSDKHEVRALTPQETALVQSSNSFGFSFFKEAVSESDNGNLFVSPLSVSMALGMTYDGAAGMTEQGMRKALVFGDLTTDQINESYQSLIALLTGMDPKVTMEIANSIWYRDGLNVLDTFIATVEKYFDAVVQALDFADPASVDVINGWVNDKTNGKIPTIIDAPIDSSTMMYLINAIYFKGTWTQKFDVDQTADATFHAPAGDKTVKMMSLDVGVAYLSNDDFQAVDLPYGDGLFSMMVILPNAGHDIDAVAAELNDANWSAWLASLMPEEVQLQLPRFELTYDTVLNDMLIAMGMTDAFSSTAADFSGIDGQKDLFISEVKHKTFVKVDEEGTEAAAVTSVKMQATTIRANPMIVDHPFLFVIHDNHSQALLFMGKMVDPDSN